MIVLIMVGGQCVSKAGGFVYELSPFLGHGFGAREPLRHLLNAPAVAEALVRNQEWQAGEEPVAGDVVGMRMGVDYQTRRVLIFQPLKTFGAAAGINKRGYLIADEDGVREGELSSLLSLDQEDGASDFG